MNGPFQEQVRVSVIMAVYNGKRYVREAVESLLTQTLPDFELNVVDDGSTDETLSILRSFGDPRINLLRNDENLGQVPSLNKAIATARGRYIAILDADDMALPNRLERQFLWLESHPEVGVLGSYAATLDENGAEVGIWDYSPSTNAEIQWELLFHNPLIHSSMMIRASIINQARGYRVGEHIQREFATDYDLLSRSASLSEAHVLAEVLVKYRLNTQGLSARFREDQLKIVGHIARRNVSSLMGHPIADPVWSSLERFSENWAAISTVEAKAICSHFAALQRAFEQKYNRIAGHRRRHCLRWARRFLAQARRNPHIDRSTRIAMIESAARMVVQSL